MLGAAGLIMPQQNYLKEMRKLCDRYGILLVFDEIVTFRFHKGGMQTMVEVEPDLTCIGKIIGGGLPVGAFGGKKEIMEKIAPLGPVYQAGTLSGNPVSMAAGLTTLKLIQEAGFHDKLAEKAAKLCDGMRERASAAGVPLTTNQVGAMFGFFFSDEEQITSFKQVTECNIERFQIFYRGMLSQGVYLAPSAYEAGFVSGAHTDDEINATLDAAEKVFASL